MADVWLLEGAPRDYTWGSTTAIPELLGREPDGRPLAELWFGAHPHDAAFVPALGRPLDEVVAADPAAVLGADVAARYGELPFMVKLLAAQQCLSIQVHPTREQAVAGYDREDARGLPPDAPHRCYRDRNHKPELIFAITEFEALCGFRPVPGTLRLLELLGVPGLEPVADLLRGPDGLRAAFTHLLALAEPAPLVAEVVAAAEAAGRQPEFGEALHAVRQAAADFPGDAGVLVTLLLNAVRLRPGEALFLGAGNVHAYRRGLGVEVMATSDNVLRAGLTPKHVDVDELLTITDFTPLDDPRVGSREGAGVRFPVPVDDFAVTRIDLDEHTAPAAARTVPTFGGPAVLVCTSGSLEVDAGGATVALRRGQVVFASATPAVTVRGVGTAVVTTVGGEG